MSARAPERFRKRPRLNVFGVALVISLFFHLSMVTVFKVVVLFPQKETKFFDVSIVQNVMAAPPQKDLDYALPDMNLGGASLGLSGKLAGVELPTIEFAELERLKVRQRNLDDNELYKSLYAKESDDSWSQFSGGLQELGESIRDVTLGGILGIGEEVSNPVLPTLKPAEGFAGYIDWSDASRPRKLLFNPPIKALWDIAPGDLDDTVELVFEVTAQGRVVNVYSPNVSPQGGLIDAIQLGVLQYRFEPVGDINAPNQLGTLRILADSTRGGL